MRVLSMLIVLSCTLMLFSCGGKNSSGVLTLDENEPAVQLPTFGQLPAFPSDDDLDEDTSRTVSAYTVKGYDGANYKLAECHAVEPGLTHPGTSYTYDALGLWSKYNPYIDYPGIPVHHAFALYKAAKVGQNYPLADFRKLVIEATPGYASDFPFPDDWFFPKPEYYVALANWDTGAWKFIGGPYGDLPEMSIDLTSVGFNYLSPKGHLFYLIVVPPEHNVLVHNSYLVLDDPPGPPPTPTDDKVGAKTHDFYRAYRYNLNEDNELGLYGSRYGAYGLEELGSDTGYAMYYRSAKWFKNHIGDPGNLEGIKLWAHPEVPPSYSLDEYWFALPNFDTGGWEYYGPLSNYPTEYVDLSGVNFNYLSPLGNFYYMILVKENNGVVIEKAKFFVDTGPAGPEWTMFAHGPRRTGLSDYNGPDSDALKWTFDPSAAGSNTSPIVGPDGTVYTTSYTSPGGPDWGTKLWAINPTDGTVDWSIFLPGYSLFQGTPAVGSNGHIYAGVTAFTGGFVYSWREDGTLKWMLSLGQYGAVVSSCVRTDNGVIYVTTVDNRLIRILEGTSSSGQNWFAWIDWEYAVPDIFEGSSAVAPDGTVYIGGLEPLAYFYVTMVYAINPDGTLKWSTQMTTFANSTFTSTPTVGDDGTVYVGINCNKPPTVPCGPWGQMMALNPADGSVLWTYQCDNGGIMPPQAIPCFIFGSPSLDPSGHVWFGSEDSNLLGLDPTNGTLLWEHQLADVVHTSAAIGGNGLIYLGDDSGYVYCIEANPGGTSEVWSYDTGDAVTCSPAIGSNGCCYVTATDGRLLAFGS